MYYVEPISRKSRDTDKFLDLTEVQQRHGRAASSHTEHRAAELWAGESSARALTHVDILSNSPLAYAL